MERKSVAKTAPGKRQSRPSEREQPEAIFPVAGIGSSAGGLEALETLFRAMPLKTDMAFVVISHLHPAHISMLPELLSKITSLPVTEMKLKVKIS